MGRRRNQRDTRTSRLGRQFALSASTQITPPGRVTRRSSAITDCEPDTACNTPKHSAPSNSAGRKGR